MPFQQARTPVGRRRERAIVQVPATVDDGMGGQAATAVSPTHVATIWVRPVPLDERTREAVLGGQLTAQQAYHFDTRYRTDLRPTMRFLWRGKTLQIQSVVDDDARKRRLIIYCSEVET